MPETDEPAHGTIERYRWAADPCRLPCCVAANTAVQREYRERAARGEVSEPVGPTLAKIAELDAHGMPLAAVALASGVPYDTLRALKRRTTVLKATADKVRAVKFDYYPCRGYSSFGTVNRLRGLQAMGWSGPHLCRAIPIDAGTFALLVNGHQATVDGALARRVREFYNLNWFMDDPDADENHRAAVRRAAKRKGYILPMDWAPGDIDRPGAEPLTQEPDPAVLFGELEQLLQGLDRRSQLRLMAAYSVKLGKAAAFMQVASETLRKWLPGAGVCLRKGCLALKSETVRPQSRTTARAATREQVA